MEHTTHHFRIGNIDCYAVSEGSFSYSPPQFPPPKTLLFKNAPGGELNKTLRKYNIEPDNWPYWTSDYTCLVIKTEEETLLVDTGMNDRASGCGKLVPNLQTIGIKPEDINKILITHGHPDHINGITQDDGKLVFPHANYLMGRREYQFWIEGEAKSVLDPHMGEIMLGFVKRNLEPVRDRIDIIEEGEEVIPGVSVMLAPGHTPGHLVVQIESQNEKFLYFVDALLHPIHCEHPEWCAVVDFDMELTIESRRKLLAMAANEKILTMSYHFDFPGLGYVKEKEDAWIWEGIKTKQNNT
jgi:glyoxylase-like metal-dependent hydrolase (beta-lactamase superfamily II)